MKFPMLGSIDSRELKVPLNREKKREVHDRLGSGVQLINPGKRLEERERC